MSHLENRNGCVVSWWCAISVTMRMTTQPSCAMVLCGDHIFVELLTEFIFFPLTFNWKDKSKIHLKLHDLCVIMANGDSFRFFGYECLMPPHFIVVTNPPCIFSSVSLSRYFSASGFFADMCGPPSSAAMIIYSVQFAPASTGHPSVL